MLDLDTSVLVSTPGGLASISKASLQATYLPLPASMMSGFGSKPLARDNSGAVWIGSGCGLIRLSAGNYSKFNTQNSILPSDSVLSLYYSYQTNTLWVGMNNGQVLKIDSAGWFNLPGIGGFPPYNSVLSIVTDHSGIVWAGTHAAGVSKYDGNSWFTYDTSNSPFFNQPVRSLAVDKFGFLWASERFKLNRYAGGNWNTFWNPNWSEIYHISFDSDDTLWISSSNGLYKFKGTTTYYPPVNDSLTSTWLTWHLLDGAHCWVGTSDKGVDRLQGISVSHVPLIQGLSTGSLNAVCFTLLPPGVWLSYEKSSTTGGICLFNDPDWQDFNPLNSGLQSWKSSCVAARNDSTIWIGTTDQGIFIKEGNTWSNLTMQNSLLSADTVTALTTDNNHDMLAGCKNGSVQQYSNGLFSTILPSATGTGKINCIMADPVNTAWIGTDSGGLFRYDAPNLLQFTVNNSGIASNRVTDIAAGPHHLYWITTEQGLCVYDNASTWMILNTSNSPLPENELTTVTVGKDSSVWIGTKSSGIVRIRDSVWTVYGICADSALHASISNIRTAPDGRIYVCTKIGLSIIQVDYITEVPENRGRECYVRPNPATDRLTITCAPCLDDQAIIYIYNAQGQLVYLNETAVTDTGELSAVINVDEIGGGVGGLFFYSIRCGLQVYPGKFLIQQ